jgi:uncharacterized tellurite resistance protein B-like protein
MIDRFKQFFDKHLKFTGEEDASTGQHHLHLATAALLIEMTRADAEVKPEERDAVARALRQTFELDAAETAELIELAEREAHDATCYHQFTSLINQHFTPAQKVEVVEMLWEVAYADAEMEKYEEHLVRKLADLLHVPHSAFIQAKLRVQARSETP